MERVAVIDMGTNTFHLLLAEVTGTGHRVMFRDYEAVKIGRAGINEGFISDSACERALSVMKRFREAIDRHGITSVLAFGTSAFRNASNGRALVEKIHRATGISARIISGEEEAGFIFDGIRAALDLGTDTSLVMDIGAGSVEFILGNNRQLHWKQSFEIGGQRLLERFQKHDPISPDEIETLHYFFAQELVPLCEALRKFQPKTLIGSSGSFDTLSDIFCIRNKIPSTPGAPETPLSLEGFYAIYEELIRKNRNERMEIQGMIAMRVDMIVVASCLIRFVLQQHPFDAIRVSGWSLKEGVLARVVEASEKQ